MLFVVCVGRGRSGWLNWRRCGWLYSLMIGRCTSRMPSISGIAGRTCGCTCDRACVGCCVCALSGCSVIYFLRGDNGSTRFGGCGSSGDIAGCPDVRGSSFIASEQSILWHETGACRGKNCLCSFRERTQRLSSGCESSGGLD